MRAAELRLSSTMARGRKEKLPKSDDFVSLYGNSHRSWNALRPKRYGRHAESRLNYYRYNSISDGWTSTRFGAHRVFMTVTLCYKKSIRLQQNLVFFRITNAGWACQNLRFNQSVLSRRISTMPLFEGTGGECIANRNSNPL